MELDAGEAGVAQRFEDALEGGDREGRFPSEIADEILAPDVDAGGRAVRR
ncbi:hypothetical protein [Nesterenkonia sp. DZ6]|nr:hypothetical protein [Nesterenkonia sp. DZ6]MCH8561435.1 hypothetical protein [Nesterenkonia sp. DZ6]